MLFYDFNTNYDRKLRRITVEKKLYSTVKIPLKTYVAYWFHSLAENKNKVDSQIKLGIYGNNFQRLAYFLPDNKKYQTSIIQYFDNLIIKNIEFKIICRSSAFDMFQSSIMHSGIIISDKQLNKWGLPEEATIRQLESLSIDAVIDLNPEEDPVHRMLIRSSKSPIKIGFQSKRHTSLFNITVENNREEIIEYQFNQINQLLGLA